VLVAIPAGFSLFGFLGLVALLPVTVFGLAISGSVVVALDLGPGDARGADGSPARRRTIGRDGVPVWLDRLAQWSWRGLVLAGLGWVCIALIVRVPSVVVPGLIAIVATATLLPVVERMARGGWSRAWARSR
jgi:hypothetical protein